MYVIETKQNSKNIELVTNRVKVTQTINNLIRDLVVKTKFNYDYRIDVAA